MTTRICRECYYFYEPTSSCYRDPNGPMVIEDPTAHPAVCPQDRKSDRLGYVRSKFPYCEKLCEGCRGNSNNSALPNESCQGFKVRPQSEADGNCPYHDSRELYGRKYPRGPRNTLITSDIAAAMIVRGVNEHNFAYWDCDSCDNSYGTESAPCAGFYLRYGGYQGRKGDIKFGVWREDSSISVIIDHAKIEGKRLVLWYGTEHSYNSSTLVSIPIVPIEKWSKTAVADKDEEEYDEDEECPQEAQETRLADNQKSLEAWL
jgi:hypothetical protein